MFRHGGGLSFFLFFFFVFGPNQMVKGWEREEVRNVSDDGEWRR